MLVRTRSIKEISELIEFIAAFVAFIDWNQERPYPYDEGFLRSLVDSGCKMICSGGAGFDRVCGIFHDSDEHLDITQFQVDIPYLTSRRVYYANNPTSVAIRTADSTAMMILQALSNSSECEADTRGGRWRNPERMGKDVRRSTLGIIGMGNIGRLG